MASSNRNIANILLVKLSAIGDVIHALPVAYVLKKRFPEARLTWIVEKPAYDLLTNNPYIDEIVIFDKPKFKSFSGLYKNAPDFVKFLRSRHYDIAIDLQAIFKGAIIAFLSGAPQRFVYCNARELSGLFSTRICGPNQNGHVVDRYLDVARALDCDVAEVVFPIVITEQEKAAAAGIASQAGMDLAQPYIILAPGANWPNKRWAASGFAALAEKMLSDGFLPVIAGGPGDSPLAGDIAANMRHKPVDITGRTSLKQLAYFIKNACAFVGGDTGPMHLAAALGTKVIALYGPTDTVRNGPYGNGHKTILVPRSCAGCWKRQCKHDWDCLALITAGEVYDAIREVLG